MDACPRPFSPLSSITCHREFGVTGACLFALGRITFPGNYIQLSRRELKIPLPN